RTRRAGPTAPMPHARPRIPAVRPRRRHGSAAGRMHRKHAKTSAAGAVAVRRTACRDRRKTAAPTSCPPRRVRRTTSARPAAAEGRPARRDGGIAAFAPAPRFGLTGRSQAAAARLLETALLVFVLALGGPAAFAQDAASASSDAFAAGERAFAAQDYAAALEAFRDAA